MRRDCIIRAATAANKADVAKVMTNIAKKKGIISLRNYQNANNDKEKVGMSYYHI